MKILYICNEDRATTKQRLMALSDLGIEVEVVYTALLDEKISLFKRLQRAFQFRLGFFPERNNENNAIIKLAENKQFDILFIEKGLSVRPSTLKIVRSLQPLLKMVSYNLDDVMNPNNSSIYFKRCLPLYDFIFTNKKYNVSELKAQGARHVFYFRNAYSTHVHRPLQLTESERKIYGADVSFIGTYEKERAQMINFLGANGIKVKVWGWAKTGKAALLDPETVDLQNRHVYDDEYAKVISASLINICFLRKANRDKETTRSMEIPACGGFLLAERTEEHLELFKENEEAAYFETKEELLAKVKYFLEHDEKRKNIAIKGLEKVRKYSYQNQLKQILDIILVNNATGNH